MGRKVNTGKIEKNFRKYWLNTAGIFILGELNTGKVKSITITATSDDGGWINLTKSQIGIDSIEQVLAVRSNKYFTAFHNGQYHLRIVLMTTAGGSMVVVPNVELELTIFYI